MPNLAFAYSDDERESVIKEQLEMSLHTKESNPEFYSDYKDIFETLTEVYIQALNYKSHKKRKACLTKDITDEDNESLNRVRKKYVRVEDFFDFKHDKFEDGSERDLFRDILSHKFLISNQVMLENMTDVTISLIEAMKQDNPDNETLNMMSCFSVNAEDYQIVELYKKEPYSIFGINKFFGKPLERTVLDVAFIMPRTIELPPPESNDKLQIH